MQEFYWQSGSKANGGVNPLLVVGQLAERRGDADFFWHKLNFNFYSTSN
jgi:hypothetical protein